MYPVLAFLFFASVALGPLLLALLVLKPRSWIVHRKTIIRFYVTWFGLYFLFIIGFTGPRDLAAYPPAESSPYRLPWKGGVERFVAQGNRSFTSHRDFHEYAWDFVMPIGTEVLAARAGRAVEIREDFDGIGLDSNYLLLEHSDGQRSAYAHIKYKGALIKLGDEVQQGQAIALSGLVGQTVFPHLHFYILNSEHTSSIPVSFADVPQGVPQAGHYYSSGNK